MRLVEEVLESIEDVDTQLRMVTGQMDLHCHQRRKNKITYSDKWLDKMRLRYDSLIMRRRELKEELRLAKKFWEEKVG